MKSERYTVREPGSTAWSKSSSLKEAIRDCEEARELGLRRAVVIDSRTHTKVWPVPEDDDLRLVLDLVGI